MKVNFISLLESVLIMSEKFDMEVASGIFYEWLTQETPSGLLFYLHQIVTEMLGQTVGTN